MEYENSQEKEIDPNQEKPCIAIVNTENSSQITPNQIDSQPKLGKRM